MKLHTNTHTSKLRLLILPMLVMAVLPSCTKVDDNMVSPPTVIESKPVKPVVKVENGCFVFDSLEQMDQVIVDLVAMGEEERIRFYDSLAFTSLDGLYRQAQTECSEFMVYQEYLSARSKYDKVLIFDNENKENLAPELPISNPLYAYVVNVNGDVVVGGKILNYIDLNSYAETPIAVATSMQTQSKTVVSNTNSIHIYDGKRKMWVRAYYTTNNYDIILIVGQQVKSFWGWNVYKESYWLQEGSDHISSSWEKYRLDESQKTDGWHVTGRLSDGSGIILGRKAEWSSIYESLSVFSNDMGWNNRGSFRLSF